MNAGSSLPQRTTGTHEELPGAWGAPLPEHPLEPDSFYSEGGPPGRPEAEAVSRLPSAPGGPVPEDPAEAAGGGERGGWLGNSKQDRENEEGMCPPGAGALPVAGPGHPAPGEAVGACLGPGSRQTGACGQEDPCGEGRDLSRPVEEGSGLVPGEPAPRGGGWREMPSPCSPGRVLGKPRDESQSLTQTTNSPRLSCRSCGGSGAWWHPPWGSGAGQKASEPAARSRGASGAVRAGDSPLPRSPAAPAEEVGHRPAASAHLSASYQLVTACPGRDGSTV